MGTQWTGPRSWFQAVPGSRPEDVRGNKSAGNLPPVWWHFELCCQLRAYSRASGVLAHPVGGRLRSVHPKDCSSTCSFEDSSSGRLVREILQAGMEPVKNVLNLGFPAASSVIKIFFKPAVQYVSHTPILKFRHLDMII